MNPQPAMSDEAFLAAFLDASMPAAGFDHLGHLRAAWLLLQRRPLEDAVAETCTAIARLAAHLGAPQKYNRSLSEALVRLMAKAGAADRGLSWPGFVAANPELVGDARALLARHYRDDTLFSEQARGSFVPPDLQPL
ncbi:hypothetical protein RQP53_15280 [Paucibacter sp. APW11]|uniref:Uncharacterized protein n=1 Tax=Roseateles aquae TaxID=3077235 RepID=A0ABU3PDG5_9BURK|nr:hypothetical protein [Paucibacter sp. APW11]MDT9000636.1 hypothetical protein [Paucibacter sp. APW11]